MRVVWCFSLMDKFNLAGRPKMLAQLLPGLPQGIVLVDYPSTTFMVAEFMLCH